MAEQTKSVTPPYSAFGTFKNTVRQLGKGGHVPDRIDQSLLQTMGGSARLQFLGALRYLNLINDDKHPSTVLKSLATANDADWPSLLQEVLKTHYPNQIKFLATGSPQQLKESFGEEYPSIVTPAVRFLVSAAKDAGLPVAEHHKVQKGRTSGTGPRKRRKQPEGEGSTGQEGQENEEVNENEIPPKGMISFPIHLPGRSAGKIIVPEDIEEEEVLLIESQINYLKLYAKRQSQKKGKLDSGRRNG